MLQEHMLMLLFNSLRISAARFFIMLNYQNLNQIMNFNQQSLDEDTAATTSFSKISALIQIQKLII